MSDSPPGPPPQVAVPVSNPWLVAISVMLATFMEVLDTSIANVALPHIAGSLGASSNEGTWVLTSYLVSNAIVLPLGGWASSLMGRRNYFVFCIVVFTVASFLCGAAPSLPIRRVKERRGTQLASVDAEGTARFSVVLHLLALFFGLGGIHFGASPKLEPPAAKFEFQAAKRQN